VYLDHGQELISMFAYLSDVDVVLGEKLGKGRLLARSAPRVESLAHTFIGARD
jgi:hypothetical protein